jgi:hypothetical protein
MQKKLLVFATALAFSAATLIVSKSAESFTVAQGDKLSLFCQSDEPYVYCQWEHINKQVLIAGKSLHRRRGMVPHVQMSTNCGLGFFELAANFFVDLHKG